MRPIATSGSSNRPDSITKIDIVVAMKRRFRFPTEILNSAFTSPVAVRSKEAAIVKTPTIANVTALWRTMLGH
jgi:hypothetical protein